MLYRVHIYTDAEGSAGYAFCKSKKEVREVFRDCKSCGYDTSGYTVSSRPTPKTQRQWLELLRDWGSHADNGPGF